MNGYGPFEQPVDNAPEVGRTAPRWVKLALLGPALLFMAWMLAETFGVSHPALRWTAVACLAAGAGVVLAGCMFHLARKLLRRP
jgi:hypothetical protein